MCIFVVLFAGRDPMTIERSNLLTVCKLVIKELIGSSLKHGRMIDDDHAPLQQFFVVLEHALRHRIKRKCIRAFASMLIQTCPFEYIFFLWSLGHFVFVYKNYKIF